MADIVFKRTGTINKNGSVMGELTIGAKTWPTMERGVHHTFVRKGEYELLMTKKTSGRKIECLCFWESKAISTHLIHDAMNDDHTQLEGCIGPGLTKDDEGVNDGEEAMDEIFAALGGYKDWKKCTIDVQNNISGDETKDDWIKRRRKLKNVPDGE